MLRDQICTAYGLAVDFVREVFDDRLAVYRVARRRRLAEAAAGHRAGAGRACLLQYFTSRCVPVTRTVAFWKFHFHCRANVEQIKESGPDSGLSFQSLKPSTWFPLRSEAVPRRGLAEATSRHRAGVGRRRGAAGDHLRPHSAHKTISKDNARLQVNNLPRRIFQTSTPDLLRITSH